MRSLRAILILTAFTLFTLPLMPLQSLFVATRTPFSATFPHWYHRQIARLLGLRIHVNGTLERNRPLLLVANHVSWLDIVVLSAVTPVSFVAKKEVRSWPFVGWLARLQRTVFIDRERRASLQATSRQISRRLHVGDKVLFFPEGTSSDGNRILPFKSSLFAAVRPRNGSSDDAPGMSDVMVQTMTLAYTHARGLPLGRAVRPLVAWYGDMALGSHAWELLRTGPLDVCIAIGPAIALETFESRKDLARFTEKEVRTSFTEMLTNGEPVVREHLDSAAAPDMTAPVE
ncbi:MAG: lysophospholipid acyltransferase family protein [Hyphomicrobiaceae bacterium]